MVRDYGLRIFLVSLLIALIGQLDQFVIGLFHPLAEVAPYALAIKLQALIAAPAITVAAIVAPRIAGGRRCPPPVPPVARVPGRDRTRCGGDPGGAVARGVRGDRRAVPRGFVPAGRDGAFLLLSALAPLPSIALNQTGHAGERLRVAAITLAINLVLDLALVPPLGAWGAVVGTTVAFAYYFVRHHLLLERALREEIQHPRLPLRRSSSARRSSRPAPPRSRRRSAARWTPSATRATSPCCSSRAACRWCSSRGGRAVSCAARSPRDLESLLTFGSMSKASASSDMARPGRVPGQALLVLTYL